MMQQVNRCKQPLLTRRAAGTLTRGGAGGARTDGDGGVSKSQSRDVFACDDASVAPAGLSGFLAAAGENLIPGQRAHFSPRYSESTTEQTACNTTTT